MCDSVFAVWCTVKQCGAVWCNVVQCGVSELIPFLDIPASCGVGLGYHCSSHLTHCTVLVKIQGIGHKSLKFTFF